VQACIVHHDGTTSHAAASSLGVMLNKVCIKEGVALVNIVRKQEQVDLLTKLGAKFVVNSSSESFKKNFYKKIDATGFNTYGSVDNKQVPILSGEGLRWVRFFTDAA
jgi:D-arabinose 1-dehydrogenase-like Zn-dependent alcohol dehydrogenase